MGGHGGLNILPQKKWNVYNYDNRDIVQKDKKLHAKNMRKKYQTDRKSTLQSKFDVLKGDLSQPAQNEELIKRQFKKDSILNHQFKRLAEQNQHVNLFEKEQKIIQNREVLEYEKLKQSEWLKGKDLDYSSKFLGTYNDDSKIPWYAKNKETASNNEIHSEKALRKQRYDMQDLTDRARLQKLNNKEYYRKDQRIKILYDDLNEQKGSTKKPKIEQNSGKHFNEGRQRTRDKKYEFLRQREELKSKVTERPFVKNQKIPEKKIGSQNSSLSKQLETFKSQSVQKQNKQTTIDRLIQKPKEISVSQQMQLEQMRLKRLKREEKERKRALQMKKKLMEKINQR